MTKTIEKRALLRFNSYLVSMDENDKEMRQNLFVDLLAHRRNGYRRLFPADIKYYLSRIMEKIYKVEFVSLRRYALRDYV